jgi:hypothetical protein
MRRLFLRWSASVILLLTCLSPLAPAQGVNPINPVLNPAPNQNQQQAAPTSGGEEKSPSVFPFFVAASATLLILFTLLKPTRTRL